MSLVSESRLDRVGCRTLEMSQLQRLALGCLQDQTDMMSQLVSVGWLSVLGGASPVFLPLSLVSALIRSVLVQVEVLHGKLGDVCMEHWRATDRRLCACSMKSADEYSTEWAAIDRSRADASCPMPPYVSIVNGTMR